MDQAALMQFLPMIGIFILFWFLMVRPQQKKMKEHKAMLDALQKGDEVLTQGGIVGRITKAGAEYLSGNRQQRRDRRPACRRWHQAGKRHAEVAVISVHLTAAAPAQRPLP